MVQKIVKILQEQNVLSHHNQGITVCVVKNTSDGILLADVVLTSVVDRKTVLYLSGGKTPLELYSRLAKEETIKPGAVALVDERFGKKFHKDSNETLIRDTGFLRYLEMIDVPFYPLIRDSKTREQAANLYDRDYRRMNSFFQTHIGILGVGIDGHTSSIIPNRPDFKNPMFDRSQKDLLISEFNDSNSAYNERVGMTFLGLAMLDVLIILAFGEDKKEIIQGIFDDGAEEQLPARFFKRAEVAKKTLFITDQTI